VCRLKTTPDPRLKIALNTRLFPIHLSPNHSLTFWMTYRSSRPGNARRSPKTATSRIDQIRWIATISPCRKDRLFSPISALGVESGRIMETFLNLAWACLAILSLGLWVRFEHRTGAQRRMPLIALVMLLVILFPVISVSDDLWSIQTPAETDTCQRRNQIAPSLHSIIPVLAAPLAPLFAQVTLDVQYFSAPVDLSTDRYGIPALEGIDNRPPPAA
jgi:hypothetical protein